MADYYVSTLRGNDTTGNGTAATPWKTIGKAVGSSPAITLPGSGTTRVYVEPGTYYETVTLGLAPTSAAPLEIIGDCDGAGFLAGGYATPATGVVDWSAWTDDATVVAGSTLTGNTASYVTLRKLKILGGNTGSSASCVHVTTGSNWTLADCVFIAHFSGFNAVHFTTGPQALNLTAERCDFYLPVTSSMSGLRFAVPETSSEYDMGTVVRNCRFHGGGGGSARGLRLDRIASTGLGSLGRGLSVQSCWFSGLNGSGILVYTGTTIALSTPAAIRGCLFERCAVGIEAGATTQVAEDWNAFQCPTPRTNVSIGANSSVAVRPAIDRDDGLLTGLPLRPYGEPTPGSPLGGFASASGLPAVDRTGRARPEGFGSTNAAAGALERHDSGVRNATYQDSTSTACLELSGPASQERPVLVDAASTVITVKVRWDGNHGDGSKPQATILANPEIGVAAQTVTASSTGGSGATPNAYETLTFAAITPTAKGVVMLRLASRAAAGNGKAYFDTIGIA